MMPNHDTGKYLVMRMLDLREQAKEIREEMNQCSLSLKDYLRDQKSDKCVVGGYKVFLQRTRSMRFTKTRLVEKYGPSVLDCASYSDSYAINIQEVK